jgi:hypothetical protein
MGAELIDWLRLITHIVLIMDDRATGKKVAYRRD